MHCAVKEVLSVKRVKSGCILQTLVFSQADVSGHSREGILKLDRDEFERYKQYLKISDPR